MEFETLDAGDGYAILRGKVPAQLVPTEEEFERLWELHPDGFHTIRTPGGRIVSTPRWQQAFGRSYRYSGSSNEALPVPGLLEPFLDWARNAVDVRLDGLLLNWYEAKLGHYIGKHRDDRRDLVAGAPIVTICLGESRPFRVRAPKERFRDFDGPHGTVFVMPRETNLVCYHEVPLHTRHQGRRISVTVRAFISG